MLIGAGVPAFVGTLNAGAVCVPGSSSDLALMLRPDFQEACATSNDHARAILLEGAARGVVVPVGDRWRYIADLTAESGFVEYLTDAALIRAVRVGCGLQTWRD